MKDRVDAAWMSLGDSSWVEPGDVRHTAKVLLWMRWLVSGACIFLLVYRPAPFPTFTYVTFVVVLLIAVGSSVYTHFLLATGKPILWHRMLALKGLDAVLITTSAVATGGFSHYFQFLLYYPALAMFAVVFTSLRLNLAWVTMVATAYAIVCFQVGDGLDFGAHEDKTLIIRIVVMYVLVVGVNRISSFERIRRRESMEREQSLQRERIEVSQTIHNTVAQTAYMVGLGIDRARKLARESNEDLAASLDATADLQKSVIWELRRPLDGGQVYDGTSLEGMLKSHASTFTTVTSVPAELVVHGVEPALAAEVRRRLFSIAHNALTNAFRHARAGKVEVELNFDSDCVQLSVSDDGAGLPDDYARRGQGFVGMREDAEAVGGRLIVETVGRHGGTTVSCTVPLKTEQGGRL